jgi:NAD-dependent dihydropyrimidine dehydrogenase PreA subunit
MRRQRRLEPEKMSADLRVLRGLAYACARVCMYEDTYMLKITMQHRIYTHATSHMSFFARDPEHCSACGLCIHTSTGRTSWHPRVTFPIDYLANRCPESIGGELPAIGPTSLDRNLRWVGACEHLKNNSPEKNHSEAENVL